MQATLARVTTSRPSAAGVFAYLLVSCVLSITAFVLVTLGVALGVGTLVIWIGLPLLIGTFVLVRGIGAIERSLARQLLGITIAEPQARPRARGIWRASLATFGDAQTWKNLLYLVLNVPISLISLVSAAAMIAAPLALVLTPLGYLIPTFILGIQGIHLQNTSPAWLSPIEIVITGQFDPLMFLKTLLFAAIGVALWIPMRAALRALGEFSGALARGLLSPNGNV